MAENRGRRFSLADFIKSERVKRNEEEIEAVRSTTNPHRKNSNKLKQDSESSDEGSSQNPNEWQLSQEELSALYQIKYRRELAKYRRNSEFYDSSKRDKIQDTIDEGLDKINSAEKIRGFQHKPRILGHGNKRRRYSVIQDNEGNSFTYADKLQALAEENEANVDRVPRSGRGSTVDLSHSSKDLKPINPSPYLRTTSSGLNYGMHSEDSGSFRSRKNTSEKKVRAPKQKKKEKVAQYSETEKAPEPKKKASKESNNVIRLEIKRGTGEKKEQVIVVRVGGAKHEISTPIAAESDAESEISDTSSLSENMRSFEFSESANESDNRNSLKDASTSSISEKDDKKDHKQEMTVREIVENVVEESLIELHDEYDKKQINLPTHNEFKDQRDKPLATEGAKKESSTESVDENIEIASNNQANEIVDNALKEPLNEEISADCNSDEATKHIQSAAMENRSILQSREKDNDTKYVKTDENSNSKESTNKRMKSSKPKHVSFDSKKDKEISIDEVTNKESSKSIPQLIDKGEQSNEMTLESRELTCMHQNYKYNSKDLEVKIVYATKKDSVQQTHDKDRNSKHTKADEKTTNLVENILADSLTELQQEFDKNGEKLVDREKNEQSQDRNETPELNPQCQETENAEDISEKNSHGVQIFDTICDKTIMHENSTHESVLPSSKDLEKKTVYEHIDQSVHRTHKDNKETQHTKTGPKVKDIVGQIIVESLSELHNENKQIDIAQHTSKDLEVKTIHAPDSIQQNNNSEEVVQIIDDRSVTHEKESEETDLHKTKDLEMKTIHAPTSVQQNENHIETEEEVKGIVDHVITKTLSELHKTLDRNDKTVQFKKLNEKSNGKNELIEVNIEQHETGHGADITKSNCNGVEAFQTIDDKTITRAKSFNETFQQTSKDLEMKTAYDLKNQPVHRAHINDKETQHTKTGTKAKDIVDQIIVESLNELHDGNEQMDMKVIERKNKEHTNIENDIAGKSPTRQSTGNEENIPNKSCNIAEVFCTIEDKSVGHQKGINDIVLHTSKDLEEKTIHAPDSFQQNYNGEEVVQMIVDKSVTHEKETYEIDIQKTNNLEMKIVHSPKSVQQNEKHIETEEKVKGIVDHVLMESLSELHETLDRNDKTVEFEKPSTQPNGKSEVDIEQHETGHGVDISKKNCHSAEAFQTIVDKPVKREKDNNETIQQTSKDLQMKTLYAPIGKGIQQEQENYKVEAHTITDKNAKSIVGYIIVESLNELHEEDDKNDEKHEIGINDEQSNSENEITEASSTCNMENISKSSHYYAEIYQNITDKTVTREDRTEDGQTENANREICAYSVAGKHTNDSDKNKINDEKPSVKNSMLESDEIDQDVNVAHLLSFDVEIHKDTQRQHNNNENRKNESPPMNSFNPESQNEQRNQDKNMIDESALSQNNLDSKNEIERKLTELFLEVDKNVHKPSQDITKSDREEDMKFVSPKGEKHEVEDLSREDNSQKNDTQRKFDSKPENAINEITNAEGITNSDTKGMNSDNESENAVITQKFIMKGINATPSIKTPIAAYSEKGGEIRAANDFSKDANHATEIHQEWNSFDNTMKIEEQDIERKDKTTENDTQMTRLEKDLEDIEAATETMLSPRIIKKSDDLISLAHDVKSQLEEENRDSEEFLNSLQAMRKSNAKLYKDPDARRYGEVAAVERWMKSKYGQDEGDESHHHTKNNRVPDEKKFDEGLNNAPDTNDQEIQNESKRKTIENWLENNEECRDLEERYVIAETNNHKVTDEQANTVTQDTISKEKPHQHTQKHKDSKTDDETVTVVEEKEVILAENQTSAAECNYKQSCLEEKHIIFFKAPELVEKSGDKSQNFQLEESLAEKVIIYPEKSEDKRKPAEDNNDFYNAEQCLEEKQLIIAQHEQLRYAQKMQNQELGNDYKNEACLEEKEMKTSVEMNKDSKANLQKDNEIEHNLEESRAVPHPEKWKEQSKISGVGDPDIKAEKHIAYTQQGQLVDNQNKSASGALYENNGEKELEEKHLIMKTQTSDHKEVDDVNEHEQKAYLEEKEMTASPQEKTKEGQKVSATTEEDVYKQNQYLEEKVMFKQKLSQEDQMKINENEADNYKKEQCLEKKEIKMIQSLQEEYNYLEEKEITMGPPKQVLESEVDIRNVYKQEQHLEDNKTITVQQEQLQEGHQDSINAVENIHKLEQSLEEKEMIRERSQSSANSDHKLQQSLEKKEIIMIQSEKPGGRDYRLQASLEEKEMIMMHSEKPGGRDYRRQASLEEKEVIMVHSEKPGRQNHKKANNIHVYKKQVFLEEKEINLAEQELPRENQTKSSAGLENEYKQNQCLDAKEVMMTQKKTPPAVKEPVVIDQNVNKQETFLEDKEIVKAVPEQLNLETQNSDKVYEQNQHLEEKEIMMSLPEQQRNHKAQNADVQNSYKHDQCSDGKEKNMFQSKVKNQNGDENELIAENNENRNVQILEEKQMTIQHPVKWNDENLKQDYKRKETLEEKQMSTTSVRAIESGEKGKSEVRENYKKENYLENRETVLIKTDSTRADNNYPHADVDNDYRKEQYITEKEMLVAKSETSENDNKGMPASTDNSIIQEQHLEEKQICIPQFIQDTYVSNEVKNTEQINNESRNNQGQKIDNENNTDKGKEEGSVGSFVELPAITLPADKIMFKPIQTKKTKNDDNVADDTEQNSVKSVIEKDNSEGSLASFVELPAITLPADKIVYKPVMKIETKKSENLDKEDRKLESISQGDNRNDTEDAVSNMRGQSSAESLSLELVQRNKEKQGDIEEEKSSIATMSSSTLTSLSPDDSCDEALAAGGKRIEITIRGDEHGDEKGEKDVTVVIQLPPEDSKKSKSDKKRKKLKEKKRKKERARMLESFEKHTDSQGVQYDRTNVQERMSSLELYDPKKKQLARINDEFQLPPIRGSPVPEYQKDRSFVRLSHTPPRPVEEIDDEVLYFIDQAEKQQHRARVDNLLKELYRMRHIEDTYPRTYSPRNPAQQSQFLYDFHDPNFESLPKFPQDEDKLRSFMGYDGSGTVARFNRAEHSKKYRAYVDLKKKLKHLY